MGCCHRSSGAASAAGPGTAFSGLRRSRSGATARSYRYAALCFEQTRARYFDLKKSLAGG